MSLLKKILRKFKKKPQEQTQKQSQELPSSVSCLGSELYHSQDKQDQYLHQRIFKNFKKGFFVDVGAHDGISLNNTLFFEQTLDWQGINIEPIPNVYARLAHNRPSCININCAIDAKSGTVNFILNSGYTEMLSGIEQHYDPRHEARLKNENSVYGGQTNIIPVKTSPLEEIFDNHGVKHIHYLSVDVEGAEEAVIRSINFNKVFIDVIGFENNYPDNSARIIALLKKAGYRQLDYQGIDIMMIHKNSPFG